MMTGAARVVVVALCALTPLTSPQTGSPPRRAHHALVYDDRRQVVLMTGGSTPLDGGQRFEFFNDLWAFGDSGWRSLSESGERVSGIGLAYDDRRGQVLSFGGYNGQSLGDLRRLESDQWQLIGRVPEIAAAEPGFVYDSKRDRLVVFGGSAGPGRALGETWEYDGAAWTRVAGPAPPARQAHAMVYDARRGRTVLFGGMGVGPQGQAPRRWETPGSTMGRVGSFAMVPLPRRGTARVSRMTRTGDSSFSSGEPGPTDSSGIPGRGTGRSGGSCRPPDPRRVPWAISPMTNGATGWSYSGGGRGGPMATSATPGNGTAPGGSGPATERRAGVPGSGEESGSKQAERIFIRIGPKISGRQV